MVSCRFKRWKRHTCFVICVFVCTSCVIEEVIMITNDYVILRDWNYCNISNDVVYFQDYSAPMTGTCLWWFWIPCYMVWVSRCSKGSTWSQRTPDFILFYDNQDKIGLPETQLDDSRQETDSISSRSKRTIDGSIQSFYKWRNHKTLVVVLNEDNGTNSDKIKASQRQFWTLLNVTLYFSISKKPDLDNHLICKIIHFLITHFRLFTVTESLLHFFYYVWFHLICVQQT
jgi:hypothetical protein